MPKEGNTSPIRFFFILICILFCTGCNGGDSSVNQPDSHENKTNADVQAGDDANDFEGGEETVDDSSNPVSDIPSIPKNVIAVGGNKKTIINWTDDPDTAVSYNLYYSTSADLPENATSVITDVIPPFTHTGLINDATYYYLITAQNIIGESALSRKVSATPRKFSVILGENTVFHSFNVDRTAGTGSSDGENAISYVDVGPEQKSVSQAWAGVEFYVNKSPTGNVMAEAVISITFSYKLDVDFDVLPKSEYGGGSADARIYGWIANQKKELDNIVFIHDKDTAVKTGAMTFTHNLIDAPTWTHLYASKFYEVTTELYTHAQVYTGNSALAKAEVTVTEIKIEFPSPLPKLTNGSEDGSGGYSFFHPQLIIGSSDDIQALEGYNCISGDEIIVESPLILDLKGFESLKQINGKLTILNNQNLKNLMNEFTY
jgi:hypothetical protein